MLWILVQVAHDTVDGEILKGMAATKLKSFSLGTVFLIFLGIFLALSAIMIGTFHSLVQYTVAYQIFFFLS